MNNYSFGIRGVSHKHIIALAVLIVISLAMLGASGTGRLGTQVAVTGEQKTMLCSLEDAFSAIAERASGGVVSITAIQNGDSSDSSGKGLDTLSNSNSVKDNIARPVIPHDRTDEANQVKASGSGTIVSHNGSDYYVLTNYHVVENTYQVSVKLASGTELKGIVIGLDPATDLAVVKISSPELSEADIVPMGDSNTVKVGSWALAVGSPYGFEHTLTVGIISALHRELSEEDSEYPDLIQTDAAINKGNSGGPLLDFEGQIIGINAAIASPTGGSIGLGFAIPINSAKSILGELIQNGRVIRGWLGLGVQDLNPVLQQYYGVKQGVLIASVDADGPAAHAGIVSEDILVKLGDAPVTDVNHMRRLVADIKPGTSLPIVVIRSGQTRVIRIEAGLSPSTPAGRPTPPAAKIDSRIRVRTLTENLAKEVGLSNTTGVIVIDVPADSPADNADLNEGDIIIQVNGNPVANQAEFDSLQGSIPTGGIIVLKIVRKGETRIIGYRQG